MTEAVEKRLWPFAAVVNVLQPIWEKEQHHARQCLWEELVRNAICK